MLPERYREVFAQHRWQVPAEFNIATAVCGRHAADRSRFAMYWEDESGSTAALTFWDLQQRANRLSNALAELGIGRGDTVAIILPQRPETAIAHIACYQMGAIAVPLSFLFGPEALEYRLHNAEARVALVDSASLPNLAQSSPAAAPRPCYRRRGCPRGGPAGMGDVAGEGVPHFSPVSTRASDPALLVYTSGTTGPPKGALMPHRCLLGNLPGFVCSHDGFPPTRRHVLVAG